MCDRYPTPPLTSPSPIASTTLPATTTQSPPPNTTLQQNTTSLPLNTTLPPPNSTSTAPNTTTSAPNTTTSAPNTTSAAPNTTTSAPNTTSASPNTTTSAPNTTTSAPNTTTSAPNTTTSAPNTTTSAPNTTTSAPNTTTSAPNTTTSAPNTTTSAPNTTTSAPNTTTSAPNTTTSAPSTIVTPQTNTMTTIHPIHPSLNTSTTRTIATTPPGNTTANSSTPVLPPVNTATASPKTTTTAVITTTAAQNTTEASNEEQANQLLDLTSDVSKLNSSQVDQLVSQLEALLAGPNVSLALGKTSVTIVSNLLGVSSDTLASSSTKIIGIVDTVGLKLVVQEDATILTESVALAVKTVDGTDFQRTSFSIRDPNSVQIRGDNRARRSVRAEASSLPQGSVTFPSSLTANLSPEQQLQASRLQFNFYQKSTVFQDRALGDSKLNSGILGASVANLSIKSLQEDVVITLRNTEPVLVSPANTTLYI
ncbi:mucin-5AC [Oncorhynchus mykiss]|uniref:mucin-5AC n=1 Tax=Oncorhynchus mykiss TaxID=8022 RepID=UPI001877D034|nr:mucin-5AC [Oncorhynchus mykiss]